MKLDLKIISFGRVGTMAINRYLNEHPQISVPDHKQVTSLFREKKAKIEDLSFGNKNQLVNGLIVHHQVFLAQKNRSQLANLSKIKTDKLIHLVRDPFQHALGWINYINACAEANAMDWKAMPSNFKSLLKKHPNVAQSLRAGFHALYFYDSAKNVKLVDFESLSNDRILATMADIYQFLGVDSTHTAPSFMESQNSLTDVLLRQGLTFEMNGQVIEIAMKTLERAQKDNPNLKPWVTLHDTQDIFKHCPSLTPLKGDLLLFPVDPNKMNSLKYDTRKRLFTELSDILPKLLGQWATQAEITGQKILTSKVDSLSDEDHQGIKDFLKHDIKIFTDHYPEYKTKWDL
jgi:hypothetical protein